LDHPPALSLVQMKNNQEAVRERHRISRRDFLSYTALVDLTGSGLREFEDESSAIKVHGGRMNKEQMKIVDQQEMS